MDVSDVDSRGAPVRPAGFALLSWDGTLRFVDAGARELFGLRPDALPGLLDGFNAFRDAPASQLAVHLEAARSEGSAVLAPVRLAFFPTEAVHSDNPETLRPVALHIHTVNHVSPPTEEPDLVLSFVEHASGRTSLPDMLLQAIPDILFSISRKGVLEAFHHSPASQRHPDYSRFVGRHMREFFGPNTYERARLALEAVWDSSEPQWFEYKVDTDDGAREYECRMVRGRGDSALAISRDVTERKALERDLELIRFAVEYNTDPAFWITGDARIKYANKAACELLEYTKEELLSMRVPDIDPNLSMEDWPDHWARTREDGHSHFESLQRTKSGKLIPVEVSTSFLDHCGSEYHWAFVRDITQRREAEQKVDGTLRMLEEAQEITRLGHYMLDLGTGKWRMSRVAREILGVETELDGGIDAWLDLIHPDDRSALAGHLLQEVLESGESFDREYRVVQRGSEKARWVHGRGKLISNGDYGQRMLGTIQDITARKEAERGLWLMQRAIDHNADVMLRLDEAGRVTYANRAASSLLGYEKEDLIGMTVVGLGAVRSGGEWVQILAESGRRGQWRFRSRLIPKSGEEVLVECTVNRVSYLGEEHAWLAARDQREVYRLERELLDISEREREAIGQNLHDALGQSLTGLGLLIEVLKVQVKQGQPVGLNDFEELQRLVKAASAQTRFVSRGLLPVRQDGGSLQEALQDLSKNTEQLFAGVSCDFDVSSSDVSVDSQKAQHLYHIAQEAVTNAVRHGGATEISLKFERSDCLRLEVRDNGSGIPDAAFKAEGLGLRIMERRAHLIGGEVEVTRLDGDRGTVVTCCVPTDLPGYL